MAAATLHENVKFYSEEFAPSAACLPCFLHPLITIIFFFFFTLFRVQYIEATHDTPCGMAWWVHG